jgi:hypothetical protein
MNRCIVEARRRRKGARLFCGDFAAHFRAWARISKPFPAHFRALARERGKMLRDAIVPRAPPGGRGLFHGLAGGRRA